MKTESDVGSFRIKLFKDVKRPFSLLSRNSLLSDLLLRGSSEVIILGLYWLGTVL